MLFYFQFQSIKSWKSPNFTILLGETEVKSQTIQDLKPKMPERMSKREIRRDSPTSLVEEREAKSLRTENAQSFSDRELSENSEEVEKSLCRRI